MGSVGGPGWQRELFAVLDRKSAVVTLYVRGQRGDLYQNDAYVPNPPLEPPNPPGPADWNARLSP